MRKEKKIALRAFDLFSGIGGFRAATMSLGIRAKAEIDFVGFCELDRYAVKTYTSNFDVQGEVYIKNVEDITKLNENDVLTQDNKESRSRKKLINNNLPDFDILFAGFPCQSHSLMGNRKGVEDDRGSLFYSIREILRVKKPKYFILENVRAIKSVNDGAFFKYILKCLQDELGYQVSVLDLNSADYGVPQIRRRTLFIGELNPRSLGNIAEPSKISTNDRLFKTSWHLLEKEVEPKYFLSEKIKGTILADQKKGYKRKAEINKLIARPLTKTMHKMHRASQDNYYSLDFILGDYRKKDEIVVLNKEYDSNLIRRITPLEAFRLQGFPDLFVHNAQNVGVSDTQLYMQAGNAATVTVISAILEDLLDKIATEQIKDVDKGLTCCVG